MKGIVLALFFSSATMIAMNEWPVIEENFAPVVYNAHDGSLVGSVELRDPSIYPDLETAYKITVVEDVAGYVQPQEHFRGFYNERECEIKRAVLPGSAHALYVFILLHKIEDFKDKNMTISSECGIKIAYNEKTQSIKTSQNFSLFTTMVEQEKSGKIKRTVVYKEKDSIQDYQAFRRNTDNVICASFNNLVQAIEQFKE